MLWTNLGNQVRQTLLPKWKLLIPLFEAVMNSFRAIRDAKRTGKPVNRELAPKTPGYRYEVMTN